MAIDTEAKRRSVLGSFMVALTVLPVPDSTVGTQDRPHVDGIYAGVTIDTAAFFVSVEDVAMIHPSLDSVTLVEPTLATATLVAPALADIDLIPD